jgi:O-succinylbenzoate synthase
LRHACGLGTGRLFIQDVADVANSADGYLPVEPVTPDPARLDGLKASPQRRDWWLRRIISCYRLLS